MALIAQKFAGLEGEQLHRQEPVAVGERVNVKQSVEEVRDVRNGRLPILEAGGMAAVAAAQPCRPLRIETTTATRGQNLRCNEGAYRC